METGSFLELDLRQSGEYFQAPDITRLNAARAGIYHAMRIYGFRKIYIPYYQCPTVSAFLKSKQIEIEYYHIDKEFEPLNVRQSENSVILLVNYFGILSLDKMQKMSEKYSNVIIDNSAAFYMSPLPECLNVYSARKFFGVPDGCYVIGKNAEKFSEEYSDDYSSDTAAFLLKRIEYGCSAVYAERMRNEERIDKSDILKMSTLTRSLLSAIDYNAIASRRKSNFYFAHSLYKNINLIDPTKFIAEDNVAMVYPLVVEDKSLMEKLREKQIYTGRWWNSVLQTVEDDSFEAFLSTYMLPLPIDQRYNNDDVLVVNKIVTENIENQY